MMMTTTARAQGTGLTYDVQLTDLTVDDQPPPGSYAGMISNAIRPTIDPILACYRERLAERPGIAGEVRLRLWVSAREVIRATQEASTLGDAALEECARQRIYQFRLPNEAPAGGAWVRFALRFTTNSRPDETPVTPATTVAPPQPESPPAPRATVRVDTIRGALDAETLSSIVPTDAFDACPAGIGDIELRVTAARNGRMGAQRGRTTLRDRALIRCLVAAVRAQSAPAAQTVTRATITITLQR